MPSWNLIPSLNLNEYSHPSLEMLYSLATAGTKSPDDVAFTRPSNTLNNTSLVPAYAQLCGSRLSRSCVIPTVTLPPEVASAWF